MPNSLCLKLACLLLRQMVRDGWPDLSQSSTYSVGSNDSGVGTICFNDNEPCSDGELIN